MAASVSELSSTTPSTGSAVSILKSGVSLGEGTRSLRFNPHPKQRSPTVNGDRDPQVDREVPQRDDTSGVNQTNRRRPRRAQSATAELADNGGRSRKRPARSMVADDDTTADRTPRAQDITQADLRAV